MLQRRPDQCQKLSAVDRGCQNQFLWEETRVKIKVSLDVANANATVILKLINKNRWKIYDLEYQSVSILDIEKIGYDSKIKRQGIEKLIQKMLSKS